MFIWSYPCYAINCKKIDRYFDLGAFRIKGGLALKSRLNTKISLALILKKFT